MNEQKALKIAKTNKSMNHVKKKLIKKYFKGNLNLKKNKFKIITL